MRNVGRHLERYNILIRVILSYSQIRFSVLTLRKLYFKREKRTKHQRTERHDT